MTKITDDYIKVTDSDRPIEIILPNAHMGFSIEIKPSKNGFIISQPATVEYIEEDE